MPTANGSTAGATERHAMLQTMAEMQDAHNTLVHEQWRTQGYEYYRAMWVECAEMLDHFGWKWWKKQDGDLDQVKLELVDIWHFALSELLRQGEVDASIAEAINGIATPSATTPEAQAEQFRLAIEALAASCLRTRSFELQPFLDAMAALPMAFEELFALYIGKNMLNRFRQNNGYKTGEYRKLWSGREDNEHLIELLDELEVSATELPEALYAALQGRYSAG
jgi:dimeric dUTPase (all-alpha-NTP-PPase superfamily)